VVDIGGSNVRTARVRLEENGRISFPAGRESARLRRSWESADEFFRFQADLSREMKGDSPLPLGYCFSYPARALPGRDALLLRWTKSLQVPGVAGKRVGKMLRGSFRERGIPAGRVVVLNDTVAALLAGSWVYGGGEFSDFIGLVVGTGNNMAACFPVKMLPPGSIDASYRHDRMAINLESGNFHPPHLSPFDDLLDSYREDAGKQRAEKAISGKFLPELFSFIRNGRANSPPPAAEELFRLAREETSSPGGRLAAALVHRSADLVAASLAGLIRVLKPEKKVGILTEGSVINRNPAYRRRVAEKLAFLLGRDNPAGLLRLEDANLIGAALAALI
jgi:hexokinase